MQSFDMKLTGEVGAEQHVDRASIRRSASASHGFVFFFCCSRWLLSRGRWARVADRYGDRDLCVEDQGSNEMFVPFPVQRSDTLTYSTVQYSTGPAAV
jgi:hypothetical protein